LKIWQIWLKTPIPARKICVLGVLPLYIIFRHRDPKRRLIWRETASYENRFSHFCCRRRQE